MTEVRTQPTQAELLGTPCKRCKQDPTVIISRKDNFCKKCFIKFITGKQRKQMSGDKFKIKYGNDMAKIQAETPNVLLPLSLGKSSIVLLDIIVSWLEEHLTTPRGHLGFNTIFLIIDESKLNIKENSKSSEEALRNIKEFYGEDKLTSLKIQFKIIDPSRFIYSPESLQKLHLGDDYRVSLGVSNFQNFSLVDLLAQCPNKSTKEDFVSVIFEDLILKFAIANTCSVIVYGHCMTKLADDVIALTVRGRGAEIASKMTDGEIKYLDSTLDILHPLRDVLQTEINAYSELRDLDQFCIDSKVDPNAPKKTAKSKTINELSREYFEVIEKDYPETVSSVVKIGSKLAAPVALKTTDDNCILCHRPLYHDPKEWLEQIIVHNGAPLETEEEKQQLQVYLESIEGQFYFDTDGKETVPLCYGCIVSLGGSSKEGFAWPVKRQSKEDILKEYVLTDDEDGDESEL